MAERLQANGRSPSITTLPTKPAFLTQPLVIPQNLNQPVAFHVHNFCGARRPFPTQTTRHLLKHQQPTRVTTPQTCAKTRSRDCELALAQHSARRAEVAQAASRFPFAQNVCQRTGISCSGALAVTKLVFNVQTAHFKAGKPISAKISAS